MGRPIIGITAPTRMTKWGPWDMDATVIPATYALAVIEGGGVPIIIPPEDDATEVISVIDGLVISGGPDIDPSMYGDDLDPDTLDTYPKQDMREIALIKAAIEADLPTLGICRGMQIMCVAEGGSGRGGAGGRQPPTGVLVGLVRPAPVPETHRGKLRRVAHQKK